MSTITEVGVNDHCREEYKNLVIDAYYGFSVIIKNEITIEDVLLARLFNSPQTEYVYLMTKTSDYTEKWEVFDSFEECISETYGFRNL